MPRRHPSGENRQRPATLLAMPFAALLRRPARVAAAVSLAALSLAAACSNETVGPTSPVTATAQITLDASSDVNFVGVRLGAVAAPVPNADTAGTGWDLGFRTRTARVNSGLGGPGTVRVACLCRNQALTTAQLQSLDTAAERARFERITADSAPADSLFGSEVFAPAMAGWVAPAAGTFVANPALTFGFRRPAATGASHPWLYSKLQVVSVLPGATPQIVVRFTTQATPLSAWPADLLDTVPLTTAPQYVKLTTTASGTVADHDLRIALEGGVPTARLGPGLGNSPLGNATFFGTPYAAAQALSTDPSPANVDMSNPNARWLRDGTTNTMMRAVSGSPATSSIWYRYDPALNVVLSRYEVYLVRTPAGLFKVQPTGYYGPSGTDRQVTIRYARIAN